MDINLNNIRTNSTMAQNGVSAATLAGKTEETNLASYDLTISMTEAAIEDIKAASIPADALRRDDKLGKLISEAFSLPAPPFPAVE